MRIDRILVMNDKLSYLPPLAVRLSELHGCKVEEYDDMIAMINHSDTVLIFDDGKSNATGEAADIANDLGKPVIIKKVKPRELRHITDPNSPWAHPIGVIS